MRTKPKIRVRTKIFVGVALLLGFAIGSIVWISSELYVTEARLFLLKQASDQSRDASQKFRSQIESIMNRTSLWLELSTGNEALLSEKIEADQDVSGLGVYNLNENKWLRKKLPNQNYEPDLNVKNSLKSGEMAFSWDSSKEHYLLWLPSKSDKNENIALCLFLNKSIKNKIMSDESYSEFILFSKEGDVFAQSNSFEESVLIEEKVPKQILNTINVPLSNIQINYANQSESFVGSFSQTSIADLGVIVLTPESRVFEVPQKIALRSLLLGLAILSFALMVASFFSDSLVSPVLRLVEMTKKLAKGDFSIRLKPSSNDEIALLTHSFNEMSEGLAEREKLKGVFGRFHSKAVFEKLLHDDALHLGGERLNVTVFFSDIRSFTSQSEQLSPEAVVEMLNEYMSEMVSVVEKYGGVVDKFIGDAIMAVWGLPKPNPKKDANSALKACFEMRHRLEVLNEKRVKRGDVPINIGMGLNSGPVIAGNIGSESRMEYTVIGDTVNTASRMETLCKELGSDLVIHESIKNYNEGEFDFGEAKLVHAKGKQDDVKVYTPNELSANSKELKAA